MAKLISLFDYDGTFRRVTSVNSATYGRHIRAVRGSHKPAEVNDALKKSSELLVVANGYAKAIKDAFESFSKEIKDGLMWSRLVSIFKKQLGTKGYIDLMALEQFEFNKRYHLHRLFMRNVQVSVQNKNLEITARTSCHIKLDKEKSDSYQQTLIVAFYDPDFEATTLSESVLFPLVKDESHEQRVSFSIPEFSTTAVVALKCVLYQDGEHGTPNSKKGMEIVKVVEVVVSG